MTTLKQRISSIVLGAALLTGMAGVAHATNVCEIYGKVSLVKVEPHDDRSKVIISELAHLPRHYYRFWTSSDRVLTQVGSAHAGNHTVRIKGSQGCREYARDYKWDGGDIRYLEVLSRQ